jgi:hypothetical protein
MGADQRAVDSPPPERGKSASLDAAKRSSPWGWIALGLLAILLYGNARLRSENRELEKRVPLTRPDFNMAAMILTSQYTSHRSRTGAWPRPEEIRKELPYLGSRKETWDDDVRYDIYRATTPGVTIQFRLGGGGDLQILIRDPTWKDVGPDPTPGRPPVPPR